jgi:hypothetical protein
MKHITVLVIALFFISNLNAQNEKFETTFIEYSQSNISFYNPKIKEFIENHAQIKYDICTQKLIGVELENKLTALFDKYGTHIDNMSANGQANYLEVLELLRRGYENCNRLNNKSVEKASLLKRKEELHKNTGGAKITFENKHFKKFANKMQNLVLEQCATNISNKEYEKKSKKIRAKYVKWFKDVSKKDMEILSILYQRTFLKCQENDIERRYSVNK